MKTSRRRQSRPTIETHEIASADSVRSNNLHVSLSVSPSSLQKFVRPLEIKKVGKKPARSMHVAGKSKTSPRSDATTSGIPKDVAVHFGNFYNRNEESRKTGVGCREVGINKLEFPGRSEFTRQMVHKLERLAGTEYYARQVSALLDETVEPPNFAVKPPPTDNFIPQETSDALVYPLWYKEPDKIPSSTSEYSISIEHRTMRENERTKDTLSTMCSTTRPTSGSRRFVDVTDSENNDESSSNSSEESTYDSNTEDDIKREQFKADIVA